MSENIYFLFVSADQDPMTGRGTVIRRGEEMVLDLDSDGVHYLLTGCVADGYYLARAEGIVAKWAKLGEEFVGTWIQEGDEWFFRFRLPAGA